MSRAAGPSAAAWSVLALAVALALLAGMRSPWAADLGRPAAQVESDFQILFAAATGLAAGLDIHDPATLDGLGRELGRPATPFCAAQPLALATLGALVGELPFEQAYRTWLAIHVAALAAAAVLLVSVLVTIGLSRVAAWGAVLLVLGAGDPTWISLAMNSTNGVALVAVTLALWAGCRGRQVLEGLALAVAIVAKTSPAWLVLVALLGRRWRTVLAAAGGVLLAELGAVAWVGLEVHTSWLTRVVPALSYAPDLAPGLLDNGLHPWNLAPHGLLARAAARAGLPRIAVAAGAWLVTLLVVAQLWQLRRRGDPHEGDLAPALVARRRLVEYALGLSGAWLASSVTWPHHLVMLVVPWCVWVCAWHDGRRGLRVVAGTLITLVLLLPLGLFAPDDPEARADVTLRGVLVVLAFGLLAREAQAFEEFGGPPPSSPTGGDGTPPLGGSSPSHPVEVSP